MSTDAEGLLSLPAMCVRRWKLAPTMHNRTVRLLMGAATLLALAHPGFPQTGEPEDERVAELRQLVEGGFYREAEERGRELLAELDARGTAEGLAAAEASEWLASALRRTENPMAEETLRLARRAVEVKRDLLGDTDPSYAVALQELATLLMLRNENESARELLEHALTIQELHGPTPELGLTLVRRGGCDNPRDPSSAESFYRRAAEVLQQLPERHVNDSWRLEGEANLSEARGEYEDALEKRRQSLALREELLRPEHPLVGQSYYEVARTHFLVGDFTAAQEHLERALPILQATYDASHRRVRDPLLLQAYLYDVLGAPSRAWEVYEGALAHLDGADSLAFLLGLACSLSGVDARLGDGLQVYRRALELARTLGPSAETDLVGGLISFGARLEKAGELEAAADAYGEARSILERRQGLGGLDEMTLLGHEASLCLRHGRGEEARARAQRCLEFEERFLGPSHLKLMAPSLTLAKAQLLLGDRDAAFASAARVEAISRRNLLECFDGLESTLATRYAGEARAVSQQAVSIALACGLDDSRRNEWILDTLVRRRALVMDELAFRSRLSLLGDDPDAWRLAQELQNARSRLANLVFRIERPTPDYRRRLDEAVRAKERLETSLARASGAHRERGEWDGLGLAEVRAQLPPRSALVSYFVALEHAGGPDELSVYLACILAARDAPVRVVRLGAARQVESEIDAWRAELLRLDAGGEERLGEAGKRVRGRIWDPVLAQAGDPEAVFIVPDGVLHRLSFAALPGGEGRYLIEEGPELRCLTTERELVPPVEPIGPGRGLLAVGVPEPGGDASARGLPRLTGAEREAHEVVDLWNRYGAGEAKLLVGEQATERAVLREAAGKRALHVACHGFSRRVPPSEPLVAMRGGWGREQTDSSTAGSALDESLEWSPLLGVGLLLARPAGDSAEDGYLSAEELAGFDLSGVEWAVLAACSTGEGPIESGEGVFGLQRALRLAGVRTTITSLWPVEDEATRAWTQAFYASCLERGRSPARAAVEAARAVLESRRSAGKSTHPFFWAAFIAAGGCEGTEGQTK